MEKLPSVINVEDKENKEKEKKSQAWETVRSIALGSMIGASVLGGEVVRELMQPQINNSEVTDNLKDINDKPEETVKEYVSLGVGDSVYRAEIDSGVKMADFQGSGIELNSRGILNYADKMIAEVDHKDGTKMVVKFQIIPEGMQIHYQQIDARGKILNEQISLLSPQQPNILEEK